MPRTTAELDLGSELDALAALDALDAPDRDDARDELHRRIVGRVREARDDLPAVFAGFDLTDETQSTRHADLIEALATRAVEFDDALLSELRRVRKICEARPTHATLWSLGAFAFLEAEADPAFRLALRDTRLECARSPCPEVRCEAIGALSGLDFEHDDEARAMLVQLLEDPSWKVRAQAEALLEEAGRLPAGHRARWTDRLRRWWFLRR